MRTPQVVKAVVSSVALAICALSYADRIDRIVAHDLKQWNIPGACVGILRDGKLVSKRAYGLADLELNAPMQPDDVFEIGSMTKQFTAALTLMLVEEGKLGLEDPVGKYVPEAPASWKDITLRHMLNQDSGLPEYALVKGVGLMDTFDRAAWMKAITPLPLDFAPGTAWAYSNTNYALLGWVIERATGKPYADLLSERILKPLGMVHSRMEDVNAVIVGRAHGYLPAGGSALQRVEGSHDSIEADGGLLSNVEDLAKWDAALRGGRLLKPESYALFWGPVKLNSGRTYPYGMGWFLRAPGNVPVVYHPGADVGYSSCITRYDRQGLTILVLVNSYGAYPEAMARHIAEGVDRSLRPQVPVASTDPDPARTRAVKAVIAELATGKPDPTSMAPEFLAGLGTSRARVFPAFNDFKNLAGFDFAGATPQGPDTLLAYRVKNPTRTVTAWILWGPDNHLVQLFVRPDPIT